MLEGLEVKEILFSKLHLDNEKFRLDDEFFQKAFIAAYAKVKTKPYVYFEDIIGTLTDYHANGSYETLNANVKLLDEPNFAYMVRSTDLESNNFETDVKYVSEHAYNHLAKSKLFGGEILINKIGTPGKCYVMPNLNMPATVGMNLFMVRIKEKSLFNELYVWAYFNCSLGKKIIGRKVNGTVPLTIDKLAVKTLPIPKLSLEFQSGIKSVFKSSEKLNQDSKYQYLQAEQTLLEAVGLVDFKPSTQGTNIKTFAQSFGSSGRLDAEYYQLKYEDCLKMIFGYKGGWAKLSEICTLKDANHAPIGEMEYQYIELSDIDKSGGITGCTKDVGENLPSRARRLVNAGDVVVSSIEGSLSSCALVRADYDNSLCSTGFYVIKSQEINSETLLVLIKSELMQSILKQNCSGTILTAINKDEFSNLPIPKIDAVTQDKIANSVQQSFILKAESERLLETAKRAVEIAIEQDENAGLAYIVENTKNIH